MLSVHPDNLIPCSTDANSGGHKGTIPPLDLANGDQAAQWFHPRWRNAGNTRDAAIKYRLEFLHAPTPHPRVRFVALELEDRVRIDNMEDLFDLSDFWGRFLDDELQGITGEIADELRFDDGPQS